MNTNRFVLLFLTLANIAIAQNKGVMPFSNGKELIHAMYKAYEPGKWYRHFTFSQEMEYYRNDSVVKREVWHEAYRPGSLIIKVGSKSSKTGRLYDNFTVHSFTEGEKPSKSARVHELLLVGLDVYFFKPERTIQLLDSLGYDLSKIRLDEFGGRHVYVGGADKGDEKSRQFWIDAGRMYMHRIIYGQKGKTNDVVFGDYEQIGKNRIAKTILFRTDGKLALIERYYDIKFPKTLPEDWFNPEKFNEVILH